ncbi:MAG: hypothetical protein IKZ96_04415 [Bacilli bacterium]|nr:hypothetical protein [Bacilli bacterium]
MNEKIIYTTENFKVCVPNNPHVSREDGGHIRIKPLYNEYESRLELPVNEAIEVMRLTMLVSEAMINGMKKRGLNIDRINYQDNGNWAFLKNNKPHFHIHLYGRTKDSKRNPWGESIKFPNPDTGYYDNFIPFDDLDIKEILDEIHRLEKTDKYLNNNWHISE